MRILHIIHNKQLIQKTRTKENDNSNKARAPTMERLRSVLQVIQTNRDAMVFFSLAAILGVSASMTENFCYVRVREVGGTGKEMGLSRLFSSLGGAAMYWFSPYISKRMGADKVIGVTLVCYVIRFVIYAFMTHPYHVFFAELLRGGSFAAFWSTSSLYASRIAPMGMQATMVRMQCFG